MQLIILIKPCSETGIAPHSLFSSLGVEIFLFDSAEIVVFYLTSSFLLNLFQMLL